MKSKNPTPVSVAGTSAICIEVVAVKRASKAARAEEIWARNGLAEPTHPGEGISVIIVRVPSEITRW
jgi:hypothetical protein